MKIVCNLIHTQLYKRHIYKKESGSGGGGVGAFIAARAGDATGITRKVSER